MPITVLGLVTIIDDNPAALARYFEVTTPLMERAGAKIVNRFEVEESVVGNKPAEMVILVEYPDQEAVDQVFQSHEYQALKPIREQAFSTYSISVIGTS